jgi:putative transposase
LIFTMPTTARGTAKVVGGRSVKFHHVYYWCEAFRDPEVQGQQIAIRFDPFEPGLLTPLCTNSGDHGEPRRLHAV